MLGSLNKIFSFIYCFFLSHTHLNTHAHMFTGPMSPGAALIVRSCGTNISANVRDGALSHNIDQFFLNIFCRFF